MRRKIFDKLLEWKNSYDKPLVLTGASGVGKSYSAYSFGKSFYQYYIYINTSTDNTILPSLITDNILEHIDLFKSKYQIPTDYDEDILLILDDVNLSKDTTLIKHISNRLYNYKNFHLLIITNYLDEIDEDFNFLMLHPLDFEEFLLATGNEWYIESIRVHFDSNKKLPDIVHNELLTLYHEYIKVGGMPLAVNEYISTESTFNIKSQHNILLNSYLHQLGRNKDEIDTLKIVQAYDTIPDQLLKENHKFRYSIIRKGATQGMYATALQYIKNSFYGVFCIKIDDINLDKVLNNTNYLEYIMNLKDFDLGLKMYHLDIGLLNTSLQGKSPKKGDVDVKLNEPIKKALYNNYVALSLASNHYPLIFWESNSQAKIEFLIVKEKKLIPIEIKTSNNTRSKNFSVIKQLYPVIKEQIKISTKNFDYQNHIKYVPIYATFCI